MRRHNAVNGAEANHANRAGEGEMKCRGAFIDTGISELQMLQFYR